MSAEVIPFPSRARPRDVQAHPPAWACVCDQVEKSRCGANWVVDWYEPNDGPSRIGTFLDEGAADRFVGRWRRENCGCGGSDPRGVA